MISSGIYSVKSETGCESIYTFCWLRLNAYSYSFMHSQTAIFSAALWIEGCSAAKFEALSLLSRERVRAIWQQKAWTLFGCCHTNMPQQPWRKCLNHLGGIRAPSDIAGKHSFLFSIARTIFLSGVCVCVCCVCCVLRIFWLSVSEYHSLYSNRFSLICTLRATTSLAIGCTS